MIADPVYSVFNEIEIFYFLKFYFKIVEISFILGRHYYDKYEYINLVVVRSSSFYSSNI